MTRRAEAPKVWTKSSKTGLKFFAKRFFLIRGVTFAILKHVGTSPDVRERFMILVKTGTMDSRHSFSRRVRIGSIEQLFTGDYIISSLTSSTEMFLNSSKRLSIRVTENSE